MASVVVNGDTSGAVTLSAPAVAGTVTVTLPSTSGVMATLTTPSFATTIGVGGATPSASGSGITFPAAISASTDANTLDDYEEGTWTPVATSAGGSITSYTSSGYYTKIGNSVTVNFRILITNNGTGSTGINVSGFPFSAKTSSTLSGASREDQSVGFAVVGSPTTATNIFLSKYDGTYPGGTNYGFSFCIAYVI